MDDPPGIVGIRRAEDTRLQDPRAAAVPDERALQANEAVAVTADVQRPDSLDPGQLENMDPLAGAIVELGVAEVDLLTLKQAGLVPELAKVVKVIKTGELTTAVKLTGIGATAGAKAAIEAAGGSVA